MPRLSLGYGRILEVITLCGMAVTLIIPGYAGAILPWSAIPPMLYLRAAFWIFGLVALPGLYALRISGISRRLTRTCRFAVAANLSLAIICLAALAGYYTVGVAPLPYALIAILAALLVVDWVRSKGEQAEVLRMTPAHWVLAAVMVATSSISTIIFFSHGYLIPGDAWVATKPAIDILSQGDLMGFLNQSQYPSMFGFIAAGFAACVGLPAFNASAALFPLAMLNPLTFFMLSKVLFKRSDSFSAIASLVYAFGGGLSWLLNAVWFHQTMNMWGLPYLCQDAYFFQFSWNGVDFTYKLMAIGFAFVSFSLFSEANEIQRMRERAPLLLVSSLLFLLAFMVHILPGFMAPVFLIIAFLNPSRRSFVNLGAIALAGALLFAALDAVMGGYYTLLINIKIPLLSNISSARLIIVAAAAISATFFAIFASRYKRKISASLVSPSSAHSVKLLITAALAAIYIFSLYYWSLQPKITDDYIAITFPWYMHVTRYGIVGFLAVLGIGSASWRSSWLKVSVLWAVAMMALGSLWWGERLNAYMYPALVILATCGAFSLYGWISRRRKKGREMRAVAYAAVGTLIALSLTSTLYNQYYYAVQSPVPDSLIQALMHIQAETPENSTVLVADSFTDRGYELWRGINTIADRIRSIGSMDSHIDNSRGFVNFIKDLAAKPFQYYAFINSRSPGDSSFFSFFNKSFSNNIITVLQIPAFSPPQDYAQVAVLDERLDLSGFFGVSALNGGFPSGWSTENIAASLNGYLTRLQWEYTGTSVLLPNGSKVIQVGPAGLASIELDSPLQGNYSQVTIRYRVLSSSSPGATSSTQVAFAAIGTSNASTSFYLPLYSDGKFHSFTAPLPSNLGSLSGFNITMSNNKLGDGVITFELDSLSFGQAAAPALSEGAWFYSIAIPALWDRNYFIADASEAMFADVLLADLDRVSLGFISYSTGRSYILFNETASPPGWGSEWSASAPGIIVGDYGGKQVIIVSTTDGGIEQGGFAGHADIIGEIVKRPG